MMKNPSSQTGGDIPIRRPGDDMGMMARQSRPSVRGGGMRACGPVLPSAHSTTMDASSEKCATSART